MARARRLSAFRAARRDRDGSAAVEFALIATPFFLMLFAILEIGLILVLNSVLENAATDASRLVRTGQAQQTKITREQFRDAFCRNMSVFARDCPERVFIDVRQVASFTNPGVPDPTSGGSFNPAILTYQTGEPGSLMLVRIWYEQPVVSPFLANTLSKLGSGDVLLSTAAAFRNEPYQ